ncbi:hypothetical protein [Paenibacillus taichungensis]
MRTIDEHVQMMWENDHLPWCKEMGHDPGTFEDFAEQLRPQITEEDLKLVGVCRVCGCTDNNACVVLGDPCYWVNDEHDLCSACKNTEASNK